MDKARKGMTCFFSKIHFVTFFQSEFLFVSASQCICISVLYLHALWLPVAYYRSCRRIKM